MIERSNGCIDLRDVTAIKQCSETPIQDALDNRRDQDATTRIGKKSERSFEIALAHCDPARFEAHSPEDAQEWVSRLSELKTYWNRRHRVE